MARNISLGHLGLASWPCSLPAAAQLLINWTWETEKCPWFLSVSLFVSIWSTLFSY